MGVHDNGSPRVPDGFEHQLEIVQEVVERVDIHRVAARAPVAAHVVGVHVEPGGGQHVSYVLPASAVIRRAVGR